MEAESLLEQILLEFPQLKWKTYKYIEHGWDNHVIILDNKIVFRMPKERSAHELFMIKQSKNEGGFSDEIELLNYLSKKVKVGIPVYKYVSKSKPIAGYDMVPGQVLTSSLYQELSQSEKESVISQLAEFITTLHATPPSIIKKCRIENEDPTDQFKTLVCKTESNVFPRLQKNEVKLIKEFFLELGELLHHQYSKVLVHNNLWGDHILWEPQRKQVNIIDFSDRALVDPAIDLVGFHRYGIEAVERILDLYGGEKDESMLYRSQLYLKRSPLVVMNGYPGAFEYGYKKFRELFDF